MKTSAEILMKKFPHAPSIDWYKPFIECMEEYAQQAAIGFAEWEETDIEDTNDYYVRVKAKNPQNKRYYHRASQTWSGSNEELYSLYLNSLNK